VLKFRFYFIAIILVMYSSGVVSQTTPELILPKDLHGTVELNSSTIPNSNKDILDSDLLVVFVENKAGEYISNAIQGQYARKGGSLHFKPYFPFERGMTYVVKTRSTNCDSTYCFQAFQIGERKTVEKAKVISIYPSASRLPENVLRFYIYFNTPMKKGEALKHIQLVDAAGNVDSHAFMEFKQELWSADGKRLTILFDPGRIKRGVSTNILRGPALIEGGRYSLSVSGAWEDVYGQQLSAKTTKKIEVVNAYRHHISVSEWGVEKPKNNSYGSLSVHFDRIIDHALIQSMTKLVDTEGRLVPGHWEVLKKEQMIQFIPEKQWEKGSYRIIIDSRLEDVSGNNLQNLLDHNTTGGENNSQLYQTIGFKI
jgi:hypothetical protein